MTYIYNIFLIIEIIIKYAREIGDNVSLFLMPGKSLPYYLELGLCIVEIYLQIIILNFATISTIVLSLYDIVLTFLSYILYHKNLIKVKKFNKMQIIFWFLFKNSYTWSQYSLYYWAMNITITLLFIITTHTWHTDLYHILAQKNQLSSWRVCWVLLSYLSEWLWLKVLPSLRISTMLSSRSRRYSYQLTEYLLMQVSLVPLSLWMVAMVISRQLDLRLNLLIQTMPVQVLLVSSR